MPVCNRKGCGKEYDPANSDEACVFHPGAPVFHEGLKSWSCCSNVNKSVLDFDEFIKIPGCTRGLHSIEITQVQAPVPKPTANIIATEADGGKETYRRAGSANTPRIDASTPMSAPTAPSVVTEEEEDDLSASVPPGTLCRRKGCGKPFVSDQVSRLGDGEGTICTYHSSHPIFHEGSKGYLCCKRRVLEFDEFLKITGCKTGRHVFVPKTSDAKVDEELTDCRYDHYQTPTEIHLSIYAKHVDRDRSSVNFQKDHASFDLYIPAKKQRFRRTLNLFGPIDAEASTFRILGTKVEVTLKKLDGRSWTLLEKTERDIGSVNFTFGVQGRVGTIGGKELVLDEGNKART